MQVRAVQVILLIFSLILSVVILIASSKYAAWSHVMVSAKDGTWLPLVFYVGTIPLFSLLYIVAHLAALQFNGLPSPSSLSPRGSLLSLNGHRYNADYTATTTFFILCVSVLLALVWLMQSILCTSCELAPILGGHQGLVPKWCPQSHFRDSGQANLANMLGTLATVKDVMQWVMVALAVALIECARREYVLAERIRRQQMRMMGAGVDFGGPSQGANVDFQTKMAGMELNEISGPKLVFRAEEEARKRKEEEERKKQEEEGQKRKNTAAGGAPLPPQPIGPGVPGNKDNYYGNGMGLQRSGTLNYMYESRVGAGAAGGANSASPPRSKVPDRQPSEPTAPPPPGNKDNYYGNGMGLQRSGTVNYESRIAVGGPRAGGPDTATSSRPAPPTKQSLQPAAPPPLANRDNYYSKPMGLQRSGTLNYESRVAMGGRGTGVGSSAMPRPVPPAKQPSQQPMVPAAPGNSDTYYGNGSGAATGLKRSGTLNYMYESRV